MTRLKLAELTSGMGALVLGVGLGALLATRIGRLAAPTLLIGLLLHAWGMWDKHRHDAGATQETRSAALLYWVCWILLGGLLVWFMASPLF